MKALKFNEFLTESFNAETPDGDAFGNFALKLLAARDQAHVFHWQTESFAKHDALGKFYDAFLLNIDTLVEMIMGIKERPVFGEATISIKNYSEAAYELMNDEIKLVIDPMHEEVYDQARLILADIDKLKYLFTLS